MNWQQLMQMSIEDVIDWAQQQFWASEMRTCAQDKQWHAEGDVWTHTQMVCRQLPELEGWAELSIGQQSILLFTALLHDVAKPITSRQDPDTGRISSPKHALKGEFLSRNILRELGCDLVTREHICKLVRYHGRPVFLSERQSPEQEVVRLSWLVSNRLLYLFALADKRGRTTDTSSRPEENLHRWKWLSQELECFEAPYAFRNQAARLEYFQSDQPNLHYVPHEDYSCTVTMLSGLPGSGKDRWLSTNLTNSPNVSLDDARQQLDMDPTDNQGKVIQFAKERCRQLMRAKTDFSFNATNLTRITRDRWLRLFSDYNARVRIVYLEPTVPQILKQNKDRSAAVPEQVILKLAAQLEPPTWLEAHELSWED